MAKQLIPEELDALIQEYLTDGIITAKERQVLLNKAASLGLNVDEVDLYIDAQQQKADQIVDAAVKKQRGQTCPFCGGSVPQLADKCPHCSEHLTVEASDELKEIIDNLETALVNFKSGKNVDENRAIVERYIRKAETYYGSNPKIQKLIANVRSESDAAEKRAKSADRKKTLGKVLTYNKKLTSAVVLIIVIAVIWGVRSIFSGPDMSDPEIVMSKMTEAIKNGDLETAEGFVEVYLNKVQESKSPWNMMSEDKWDVRKKANGMYAKLAIAALEKDDRARAVALRNRIDQDIDLETEIGMKIADKYIQEGDYEKAITESGLHNYVWQHDQALTILSKCVSDMVEKNQTEKARRFINMHYQWCQNSDGDKEKAKKHLLEILNN